MTFGNSRCNICNSKSYGCTQGTIPTSVVISPWTKFAWGTCYRGVSFCWLDGWSLFLFGLSSKLLHSFWQNETSYVNQILGVRMEPLQSLFVMSHYGNRASVIFACCEREVHTCITFILICFQIPVILHSSYPSECIFTTIMLPP